jgi:hypothetical protein
MRVLPLVVKPVLLYSRYVRVGLSSWRNWGDGLDVDGEVSRINGELASLKSSVGVPVEFRGVSAVSSLSDIEGVLGEVDSSDVVLLYAAGGWVEHIRALASRRPTLVFLRHRSGHYYLWHEIIHARFIRMNVSDEPAQPWLGYDDVVVDDYGELAVRLRALYALRNMSGLRVVSIGGVGGWEVGARAAELAREVWGLDIVTVPYSELEGEVKAVEASGEAMESVKRSMGHYLSSSGLTVKVPIVNVERAFILREALLRIMRRYNADVVTSPGCMNTIIKIAKTPPCLSYSVLNDEGYAGICEGDFVAIPAYLLLRLITSKPVFFGNPTYPHNGIVLMAHCTAPRRMSGVEPEPAEVMTHYESDEGAAIRVLMRKGQLVTVVNPAFNGRVWVIFRGKIVDTPTYPACRTQVELQIEGDWRRLTRELRGFHWVMAYGDYVREVEYALRKRGVEPIVIE